MYDALDLVNTDLFRPVNTVALKVNLRYYWDSSTGETTDPRVVAALIDYIRDVINPHAHIMIVEADASAMRVRHAFQMLGYRKLAEEKNVELCNIGKGDAIEEQVSVQNRTYTLKVARLLNDVDLLVNVPKIKIHRLTVITCALKNIFGCLYRRRKVSYHPILDDVIVAVNKIVKPHLTVADGIIALSDTPVKLGAIVASHDAVALDFTVAKLMGYNPSRIRHLRLAAQEGLGNVREIQEVGTDITDFAFPKSNHFIKSTWWNLQLKLLNTYAKIVGDSVPVLER